MKDRKKKKEKESSDIFIKTTHKSAVFQKKKKIGLFPS